MAFWSRFLEWLRPSRQVAPLATVEPLVVDEPEIQPIETAPPESVTPAFVEPRGALPSRAVSIAPPLEPAASRDEPAAALPRRQRVPQHADEAMTVILEGPEEAILWTIAGRIEAGRLDLPSLPSTSMAVIDLANNPSVEFHQLVEHISMDPVLSSELLRTANSALYASEEAIDTLHSAIVRIGLRALRSMIFSVSMRGTILRACALEVYAEDVWRQSYSVGTIAREIAPVIGIEPEKAFLVGLLQDIGKISLLAMLSKSVKDPQACTPNLVGRVFQNYHQQAGAAMARKWKLPAEFASVAGCHHDWTKNLEHTRSAALANLAYRLDMAYSQQDAQMIEDVRQLPALSFLAPQEAAQERIFELAKTLYASAAPRVQLQA